MCRETRTAVKAFDTCIEWLRHNKDPSGMSIETFLKGGHYIDTSIGGLRRGRNVIVKYWKHFYQILNE